jgi:hypothetical protein
MKNKCILWVLICIFITCILITITTADEPSSPAQFFPVNANPNRMYNGVPWDFGTSLSVRPDQVGGPVTDSLTISGYIAKRIYLFQNSAWANNTANGQKAATVRIYYKDGTHEDFELLMGINTAEWAYDRPESQPIMHSMIDPAYSWLTNIDSKFYYYGHYYCASFDTQEKLLDRIVLIRGPASGFPYGSVGVNIVAITIEGWSANDGSITLDQAEYSDYTQWATVTVTDPDLNIDSDVPDTAHVTVYSYDQTDMNTPISTLDLVVEETSANSGIFTGEFGFNPGFSTDSKIDVITDNPGLITVKYIDEIDADGNINQLRYYSSPYDFRESHDGSITLDQSEYTNIDSCARVEVNDPDLNKNPNLREDVTIKVYSYDLSNPSANPKELDLNLKEDGVDSPNFRNAFGFNEDESGGSRIGVTTEHPGYFRARYIDAEDKDGETNQPRDITATYNFWSSIDGRVFKKVEMKDKKYDIVAAAGAEVFLYPKGSKASIMSVKTDNTGYFLFTPVKGNAQYEVYALWREYGTLKSASQIIWLPCSSRFYVILPYDALSQMRDAMKSNTYRDYQNLQSQRERLKQDLQLTNAYCSVFTLPISIASDAASIIPATTSSELREALIDYITSHAYSGHFQYPNGPGIPGPTDIVIEIFDSIHAKINGQLLDIYLDPPDVNYTTKYLLPTIGYIQNPEATGNQDYDDLLVSQVAFLNNAMELYEIQAAILHSFERYQGAFDAGEPQYISLQLDAIGEYSDLYMENLPNYQASLGNFRQNITHIESEYGGKLSEAQQDLALNGFTDGELQHYRELNLSDNDIEAYRQLLLRYNFTELDSLLEMDQEIAEDREDSTANLALNSTKMEGDLAQLNSFSTYSLPISLGWNCISVPFYLVPGKNNASIFNIVDTSGQPVYLYNAEVGEWIQVSRDDEIQPLNAYWIYSTNWTNVPIYRNIDQPSVPGLKHLYTGWNAIGPGSVYWTPVEQQLPTIQDKWQVILEFNSPLQIYYPPEVKGQTNGWGMEPAKGYWIYMKEPGDLVATG